MKKSIYVEIQLFQKETLDTPSQPHSPSFVSVKKLQRKAYLIPYRLFAQGISWAVGILLLGCISFILFIKELEHSKHLKNELLSLKMKSLLNEGTKTNPDLPSTPAPSQIQSLSSSQGVSTTLAHPNQVSLAAIENSIKLTDLSLECTSIDMPSESSISPKPLSTPCEAHLTFSSHHQGSSFVSTKKAEGYFILILETEIPQKENITNITDENSLHPRKKYYLYPTSSPSSSPSSSSQKTQNVQGLQNAQQDVYLYPPPVTSLGEKIGKHMMFQNNFQADVSFELGPWEKARSLEALVYDANHILIERKKKTIDDF